MRNISSILFLCYVSFFFFLLSETHEEDSVETGDSLVKDTHLALLNTIKEYERQLTQLKQQCENKIERSVSSVKKKIQQAEEKLRACNEAQRSKDLELQTCQGEVKHFYPLEEKLNSCLKDVASIKEGCRDTEKQCKNELDSFSQRYRELEKKHTSDQNAKQALNQCSEQLQSEIQKRYKEAQEIASLKSDLLVVCKPYLHTRQHAIDFFQHAQHFWKVLFQRYKASWYPVMRSFFKLYKQKVFLVWTSAQSSLDTFLREKHLKPYVSGVANTTHIGMHLLQATWSHWKRLLNSPGVIQIHKLISSHCLSTADLLLEYITFYSNECLLLIQSYSPFVYYMLTSWHPQQLVFLLLALLMLHTGFIWSIFFLRILLKIVKYSLQKIWCKRQETRRPSKKNSSTKIGKRESTVYNAPSNQAIPVVDPALHSTQSVNQSGQKFSDGYTKQGKNSHHRSRR